MIVATMPWWGHALAAAVVFGVSVLVGRFLL